MNIEQLKARIAELRETIAGLKAGEQNADAAAKLLEARNELKGHVADLAKLEAAFADDADDLEPVAEGDGGEGEGDGAGDAGEGAGDGTPAEPTPAEPTTPAAPAPGEGDGAGDAGEGEGAGDGAPAAPVSLAASGTDKSPTADDKDDAPKVQPLVLTASAGANGVQPGQSMGREDVLRALQASTSAAKGPSAGKVRMFEVERWGADVEAVSDRRAAIDNTRQIIEARERHARGESTRPATALRAGGCFCGPDELIRTTGVVGERGRPVAGLFPSIPISGGFRAMPDIAFNVDNLGSVVQWTCTDQDAVDPGDPGTWKPCTEIDCFDEQEYVPYMVVACTTAQLTHRWAHPEQVDRHIDLLGIEYDSVAETILLDILEADAGTPLTIGTDLMADHGLVAKVVYALGSLSFALGYEHREGSGVLDRYTLIAPVGFAEALWADEKLRGFPSGQNSKADLIRMIESGSGIRIVERLDEATSRKAAAAATVAALNAGGAIDASTGGSGAATHTPLLPPTFRLYLVDTSQWVHGEGTLVGADWHRDGDLRLQNKLQYFLENIEILERLGVKKSHIIDVPGLIMGSYSDLVAAPGT